MIVKKSIIPGIKTLKKRITLDMSQIKMQKYKSIKVTVKMKLINKINKYKQMIILIDLLNDNILMIYIIIIKLIL